MKRVAESRLPSRDAVFLVLQEHLGRPKVT